MFDKHCDLGVVLFCPFLLPLTDQLISRNTAGKREIVLDVASIISLFPTAFAKDNAGSF
jgi:hypothetical protein